MDSKGYNELTKIPRSVKTGVGDIIYHAADTTSGHGVEMLVDRIFEALYEAGFRYQAPPKK